MMNCPRRTAGGLSVLNELVVKEMNRGGGKEGNGEKCQQGEEMRNNRKNGLGEERRHLE